MSDVRDQAIAAGAGAVERYNLGLHGPERRIIAAAVVDAVTPILTARDLPPASAVIAYRDAVESDLREHLLAQAKMLSPRGVGARVVDGELVTYALVERDEVLALLEGKKPT